MPPKNPTPPNPKDEQSPLSEFGQHRFRKALVSFFEDFYTDCDEETDDK